ncbi:MAG: hypothetical protein AAGK02_00770 [Pseudomonadota bacterium]
MRFASLFAWVLVPLAVWAVIEIWGTPHMASSYRFHDNGDRWNPSSPRTYIDCTYIGWTGARLVLAENGRCPWIRFFQTEGS